MGDTKPRLEELSRFIGSNQFLWGARPFQQLELSWEGELHRLSRWARSLSWQASESIERHRTLPDDAPGEWVELWRQAAELSWLPALGSVPIDLPHIRWMQGVKLRKRGQIQSFAAVLGALGVVRSGAREIVEWCAGKGHLARLLMHTLGLPAVGLERRAELCEEGSRWARVCGVPLRLQQIDVLEPAAASFLHPGAIAVGLHACGILSDRLLQHVVAQKVAAVAVVPCCHHRVESVQPAYRRVALSQAGRDSGCHLDAGALRLAVLDEDVARGPVKKLRHREEAFRLGLDLLLRESTGQDRYHPVGPLSRHIVGLPFADFCRTVVEMRGLCVPPRSDWAALESAGFQRARMARGLAMVRGVFRRPIEVWLALDRVAYLEESGFRSAIAGTICPRSETPRNIMIAAVA